MEILDIMDLEFETWVLEKKNLPTSPHRGSCLALSLHKAWPEGNCIALHDICSGSDVISDLFFQKQKPVALHGCGLQ